MPVFLLHHDDEPALEELLLDDPVQNLFLLGLLDAGVDRAAWYGIRAADGRIRATAMVLGPLCVPWAPNPADARELGAHLAPRHTPDLVVGPREACDGVLAAWTRRTPATSFDQRLYTLAEPPSLPADLEVVRASHRHIRAISALSAEMEREDLGRAPLDERAHEARVRDRIADGRAWIHEDDGEIRFLINVGTRHPFGCQVGGTYVPPPFRRRGYGTRGMRAVCHALLAEHRLVTLHVNEANTPAVRAYERVGFVRAAPYRLVVMGAA
ncbi:MAG: GNAT family N-acetyltransferase [Myxococcota bacterium]